MLYNPSTQFFIRHNSSGANITIKGTLFVCGSVIGAALIVTASAVLGAVCFLMPQQNKHKKYKKSKVLLLLPSERKIQIFKYFSYGNLAAHTVAGAASNYMLVTTSAPTGPQANIWCSLNKSNLSIPLMLSF
jgi:hypothetical protein